MQPTRVPQAGSRSGGLVGTGTVAVLPAVLSLVAHVLAQLASRKTTPKQAPLVQRRDATKRPAVMRLVQSTCARKDITSTTVLILFLAKVHFSAISKGVASLCPLRAPSKKAGADGIAGFCPDLL